MIASDLKVYRDTYVLVNKVIELQMKFPRMYKFTLGQKLMSIGLDLFEYIQLANMSKETRVKHLNGFIIKFELFKTLIRLSADRKLITIKQQADISRMINTIGKQVSAWKNASLVP